MSESLKRGGKDMIAPAGINAFAGISRCLIDYTHWMGFFGLLHLKLVGRLLLCSLGPSEIFTTRDKPQILSNDLLVRLPNLFFPSNWTYFLILPLYFAACLALGRPCSANMFKRQLLRQARATRAVRVAPSSLSSFACGALSRPSTTYKPALLASSLCRDIISRGFASAAEAPSSNDKTAGLITKFRDLTSLGVHQNIIRSLVDDMKYETMTDVQAQSINPALSGKDMYVLTLSRAMPPSQPASPAALL